MIDLLLLIVASAGIYCFVRQPFNISFVVAALNAVFIVFPALWFIHFKPEVLNYAMSALRFAQAQVPYTEARLWILLASVFWMMGAVVSNAVRFASPRQVAPVRRSIWLPGMLGLGVLPAVLLLYTTRDLDLSFAQILLPARIERGTHVVSGYAEMAMLVIPTALACIVVSINKRVTALFVMFALMALVIAFSTAQRRTFILVAASLFIAVALVRGMQSRGFTAVSASQTRSNVRTRLVIALSVLAFLGPVLWILRNYSTQLVRSGSSTFADSLAVRSFWELFFGSVASGFPTVVLVLEMIQESGVPYLYSLAFLALAPIPRSIWPDKPLAPGAVIEAHYALQFSPSLFLIPEVIMNFYVLTPLAAFAIAFALGRWSVYLFLSSSTDGRVQVRDPDFNRVVYALLLPQAAMIFKNGFALFFIYAAVCLIIARICFVVATRRRSGAGLGQLPRR